MQLWALATAEGAGTLERLQAAGSTGPTQPDLQHRSSQARCDSWRRALANSFVHQCMWCAYMLAGGGIEAGARREVHAYLVRFQLLFPGLN